MQHVLRWIIVAILLVGGCIGLIGCGTSSPAPGNGTPSSSPTSGNGGY